MILRIFTVIFTVFIIWSGKAQTSLEKELNEFLFEPEYKNATIGIHVVDLNTRETVFGLNEHQLMIPASTMKLVTSATAFELLGKNYHFQTIIGFAGKIRNSKLNGDIVVISKSINPHFLDVWAEKIKAFGIQQVNGDLVLDGSIYDDELIPDTWIWEDIGNYYGSDASAFTIYDNKYQVTFESPKQAGKLTKIFGISPEIDSLNLINKVVSSNINRDLAYIYGSPFDYDREIRGSIPKNRKSFKIKGSIPKPKELFAKELLKHLALNGVFINGKILFQNVDKEKITTAYIHESPTLTEISKVLNHESVNLFAEHFLKQISAKKLGQGRRDSSISIIQQFWADKIPDPLFMEDGSGLSHFNAISPVNFTSVLTYMHNQSEYGEAFIASLPTAGEGTLSSFDIELFPDDILQAKSGSMTRIRSYAGYLKTNNNRKLAFCIMVNHFSGSQTALIGKIEQLLFLMRQEK